MNKQTCNNCFYYQHYDGNSEFTCLRIMYYYNIEHIDACMCFMEKQDDNQ
jgi:hypothetical protein